MDITPAHHLAPYPYDMFTDMMQSKEVLGALENDIFAQHLYASICNRMWFKFTPDEQGSFDKLKTPRRNRNDMEYNKYWSASWRSAGGLIADLRAPCLRRCAEPLEDYMNWYCSGNEGHLFDDVAEMMAKLYWYSPEDDSETI